MRVSEIFYSISGEGIHVGIPTVFIRLAGCNLAMEGRPCSWCDTPYAQYPEQGEEITVLDVIAKVNAFMLPGEGWALVTGGEPLQQPEVLEELVRELKRYRYYVEVETNGSIAPPSWHSLVDSWSADIKCPSSGVCGISKLSWLRTRKKDQVKFVVANGKDLEFVRRVLFHRVCKPTILVSPVIYYRYFDSKAGAWDDMLKQREWLQRVAEFCKEQNVRMSLQMHKIIYGDKRGV